MSNTILSLAQENTSLLIAGGVVICAVVIGAIILTRKVSSKFNPYRKKPLMTKPEVVMLSKIRGALKGSGYDVHAQVAMSAIMDLKSTVNGRERFRLRAKFDRKIIDFVITDRSGNAVVLIELDDYTHISSKDYERDRMTKNAGYPTLRYRGVKAVSQDKLRNDIIKAVET